ncbi:MAG: DUF4389 domain-containing protein [Dehalococcoidia bacterium]|nr:DUF4389 domain-containing protein [Dehalococcoidia bacterium]
MMFSVILPLCARIGGVCERLHYSIGFQGVSTEYVMCLLKGSRAMPNNQRCIMPPGGKNRKWRRLMASAQTYPVRVEAAYPEISSRPLALLGLLFWLKAVLMIPHFILLWLLSIAMFVVVVMGYVVVLFTGKYPRGMFDLVVGATRWQTRMMLWLYGITDKYPPFSLR